MLSKCRRDQWRVDDLDWTVTPRTMSKEDEIAIVQYFTDMAGIERLAAALFAEQRKHADDARLREIFETFIVDEERHARVADRLAAFYDVHSYRDYRMNDNLVRFRPHFVNAVKQVSAEVANAYITSGEILLDVALLRSIDDFVDDDMSHQAMDKINRDESRHIAVDFHMVERYCDPAYIAREAAKPPKPLRERLRQAWIFAAMMYTAGPFLRDVFFAPMDLTDPSGKRMMEAFKRIQLMARKKEVAARPFTRFLRTLQLLFVHPLIGRVLGRVIVRIVGVDPRVLVELFDEDDERRVNAMSLQDLADEILSLKFHSA
jgi:hypothetical protein